MYLSKVQRGIEERCLWRLCILKGGFWRWFCSEFSASGDPWEEEWCGQKTFYHKWASPLCSLLLEGCWDSGNWHWPESNCSNRALREWTGLFVDLFRLNNCNKCFEMLIFMRLWEWRITKSRSIAFFKPKIPSWKKRAICAFWSA